MALTHLVDTSVLTRLGTATVREAIEARAERGELARAGISDLEIGFAARSALELGTTGAGARRLRARREHGRSPAPRSTRSAPARSQTPAWTQGARPARRGGRRSPKPDRAPLRRGLRPDRRRDGPTLPVGRARRNGGLTGHRVRPRSTRAGSRPSVTVRANAVRSGRSPGRVGLRAPLRYSRGVRARRS